MKVSKSGSDLARRYFLSLVPLGALGAKLQSLRGQGQSQSLQTSFRSVRDNVGIFLGRGGTIGWMVSPDGVVVIDSQFPETARVCLEGVNQRSGNRPIDFLINTHHHGDHTAGNGVFRPLAKKIVAHEKVPALQRQAAQGQTQQSEQTYADTTFASTWKDKLGGQTISAKYYGPAHTSGDSAILFERANVVHLGDLVFNRRHPFIDRPAGATIAGWIQVLEALTADHSDETLFIYGHAGEGFDVTGKKPDLLHQRDYFTALLDYVRSEIKSGKSRDEIVNATPVLSGFSDHGPLIPRVLTVAYDEVTESL